MRRSSAAFCLCLASAVLLGCGVLPQPQPLLQSGDASSAEVLYSGDVANAMPIAKSHCARYARVARLVDTSPGTAYFACDPP